MPNHVHLILVPDREEALARALLWPRSMTAAGALSERAYKRAAQGDRPSVSVASARW